MKRVILILAVAMVILALLVGGVGCKGDIGDTGQQGAQGIPGVQGSAGSQGPKGDTGARGVKGDVGEGGTPITWLGTRSYALSYPALNDAYHNSIHKTSYIWDGKYWQILAKDGAVGYPGATGAKGVKGNPGPTGATGPAFSNLGILLYVEDGTKEIAHVTYILDEPIALEDLVELVFFQELVYGTGSFGANVILGIDVDGDGYEANDLAWHIGTTQHTLAALGDDTFISMDGASSATVKVDAMSISQWWTPDESGAGFAKSDSYPWTFYGSFSDLINVFLQDPTQTSLIPDASAQVCLIRFVVGGSGSWVDIAVRVTSDMIPFEVGVFSQ